VCADLHVSLIGPPESFSSIICPVLPPPPPCPPISPGLSLLTTVSSAQVEGIYPLGWSCSQARRTTAPSITPGANSFHRGPGCGGLCSSFIAQCIIFPPLSKIFIYANLAPEPAKFCMGNCPINSAAWKYCAQQQRCVCCLHLGAFSSGGDSRQQRSRQSDSHLEKGGDLCPLQAGNKK
jgi:hypothetical protein